MAAPIGARKNFEPVDIVGIGAVSWDNFLVVPRHPDPDEKIRAIHCEECAGGMVATALVALRRWGLRCRFVGMLGFDEYSEKIIDDLVNERIKIDALVRREDVKCRRSTVLVDNRTGLRSVISDPHRVPAIIPQNIDANLFTSARVLHLDTTVEECGVEAAILAKQAGLKVTLDAERTGKRSLELMRQCDYIIASKSFACEFTGQTKVDRAAYALHLQIDKPVIVTSGARGCDFARENLAFHQPVFEVPVVDGTGAGDIFHAAFIYGLLRAWDIRKIVHFSAWAAAKVCGEIGGRKGIPTLAAVHLFDHR